MAIRKLEKRVAPDWVIVETTGKAYLADLRDKMKEFLGEQFPVVCVSVVDAHRWARLLYGAETMMTNQVQGGDILVINKVDLNPDVPPILEDMKRIAGAKPVLAINALTDSGAALYDTIEREAKRNA